MAQAENVVVFSERGLDQLEQRLEQVEKKAGTLLSRLPKEFQKEWAKAGDAIKLSAQYAITGAFKDMGSAVAAPAKSTFDQVLAEAHKFRKETSLVSVATGKSFDDISGRVKGVSSRIAELPATVTDWGRAAKRAGGDFGVAIDALEIFKDRSIQLDRPLSEMQDSMVKLRKNFGVESKQQVADFFGTMDAQANKTGITADRVERQFMTFMEAFGRMSGKASPIWTGISAAFAASSSSPEQAVRNQEYGMGTLNTGVRQVEQRMRAARLLKRGEHITDEKTGEVDPAKYLKAMKFIQRDIIKAHGGSRSRAIEVEAGDDMGARRDVAGFFNTDLTKVDDLSKLPPDVRKALDRYMKMDAGKRDQYDANKNAKDIAAGMPGLSGPIGQDAAVAAGGGAAGLTMNAAAGAFSTAVDRFGGMVASLGPALAKAGVKGVAGAVVRTVGRVAPVLSLATMQGEQYSQEQMDKAYAEERQTAPNSSGPDRGSAPAPTASGPQQVTLSPGDHVKIGEATANALTSGGRAITTKPEAAAPPGQPAPR